MNAFEQLCRIGCSCMMRTGDSCHGRRSCVVVLNVIWRTMKLDVSEKAEIEAFNQRRWRQSTNNPAFFIA